VEKEEALKITGHTQMQKNLNEEGNRGESEKEGRVNKEDVGTIELEEKRERKRGKGICYYICMRG